MTNTVTIELQLKLTPQRQLIMIRSINTTLVRRREEIMEHIPPKENMISKKSTKKSPRSMILEAKNNMTGKKPQNHLTSSKTIKRPQSKLKNQQLPTQKVPSPPRKRKIISQNTSHLAAKKLKNLIAKWPSETLSLESNWDKESLVPSIKRFTNRQTHSMH